jgi:Concanavalin A-like lectin/glucanases superfamily
MARRVLLGRLALLVLTAGLLGAPAAPAADPDLLGQWHLDQLNFVTRHKGNLHGAGGPPPYTSDSSGHGLDAQSGSPGVPQPIPGRFQNAFLFAQDTTTPQARFFKVDDTPLLEPANQVTVLAWIKRQQNTPPTKEEWIFGKGSLCGTFGGSWGIYNEKPADGQGVKFFVSTNGTTVKETPKATNVLDGQWHAVAGTYDGARVHLYVDGSEVGTGTPATGSLAYGLPEDDNTWFGENEGNGCGDMQQWEGGIDEVRVYKRALTPTEIGYVQDSSQTTPPNLPATGPLVTSLTQSGGAGGGPVVVDSTTKSKPTALLWTIGKKTFTTLPGQNALRFHPFVPTKVTLQAIGAGGKGPVKTLIVKPPPKPSGAIVKKIVKKIGKAKPVIAFGSKKVLKIRKVQRTFPCDAATAVKSGILDIKGCLQPITKLADIPEPEFGIVKRIAQQYGIPVDKNAVTTALRLSDAYIGFSNVRVNGVDLSPAKQAAVIVFPQINAIASSNSAQAVGGLKLLTKPNFLLDTTLKKGQIPFGFARLAPGSLKGIGGFDLGKIVDIDLVPKGRGFGVPQGASIKIDLSLPSFLKAGTKQLKAGARLRATTERGLIVDGINIGPITGNLGPLALTDLKINYEGSKSEWRGRGKACVPGGYCLDMIPPNGQVVIKNGRLSFAGASLVFPPPGPPLFPSVNLRRIGFGLGLDPTRITGNALVTAFKIYEIDGRVVLAFPSSRTPFFFNRDEVGPGFPGNFYGVRYERTTLGVAATASLRVPVVGNVGLGGAYLLYEYPGYIAFGGGTNQGFAGVISISGGVAGELNLSNGRFNISGNVRACLIKVICRGALGLVSSNGFAACLSLGPLNIGGGATFSPFHVKVWPFDGCKWSPFAEKHVRKAATGQLLPHTIHIGPKRPSRAVELLGKTDAPQVRVTGPGGQTLDSPDDSGFATKGVIRIIRQRPTKLTVIGLQDPAPGDYRVELLPGSPAVKTLSEATDPPDAKIKARVTGHGAKRVLRYDILERPKQRVIFNELDGKVAKQVGIVKGGGKGTLKFKPAPGRATRKVVAQFELDGLPAERRTVATFSPPSPTLGKVHGLKLKHRGTSLKLKWAGVAGAARYEIVVTTTTGQRVLPTKKHGLTVKGIAKFVSGSVSVRALASLREGAAASKTFKATAKPPTRLLPLPKAPKL